MAAHRYWRVRSPDTFIGGEYLACTELELASAFGGADLTTGKTATASASLSATYAPGKAIDDSNGTFWTVGSTAPPVGGHWLAIDFGLGGDVDIVEVRYTVRPDGFREDPVRLIVEWSDDAVTWTVLFDLNGLSAWAAGEKRTFRWDGTTAYQLTGERFNTQYAYAIVNGFKALAIANEYAYAIVNTPSGPDPSPNVTARYWRLLITKDQRSFGGGNYFCNVAELDLIGAWGAENNYVGATFSGTGNFSGATYDPAKAFDGNAGTCWSGDMNIDPSINPRWLKVDLGSAKAVHAAAVVGFDSSAPKDFKIQYSNDDVAWTTFIEVVGQTGWTGGQIRTYDPTNFPPIVNLAKLRAAQIVG